MKKTFGSSLGSFFVKTVEIPDTSATSQPQVSQPQSSQPQSTQPQFGQEDKEIKQQLIDALEKANLPGYDYFEFIKAIDAQMSIIPSEATRFQSTFAVAATAGCNVQTLLSSAQHYLDVLKGKEQEFVTAMDKHSSDAIGGKEGQITSIDDETKKKSEEIQKLTQEINVLQEQKKTLTNEISSNKIKIETVKNNFFATLKVFTDRINNDINKIKQYLSPIGGGK
jgi:chromosome segregation ATPase